MQARNRRGIVDGTGEDAKEVTERVAGLGDRLVVGLSDVDEAGADKIVEIGMPAEALARDLFVLVEGVAKSLGRIEDLRAVDMSLRGKLDGFERARRHPEGHRPLDRLGPNRDAGQLPELAVIVEDFLVEALVNDVIGLGEAIAAGEGINVVGDVFLWHAADDAGNKSAAGKTIEHRKLFRSANGMTQRN